VLSEPTSLVANDLWPGDRFGPLIGRSAPMREIFGTVARVAATDSTVLLHGETGTGKEVVARAVHEASPRAGGAFVIIDCGALPETLLDSELFGHARGAFTGAQVARAGAIETAAGGTVFLDEIGELPLALQPKLLRVIESRTVRRLGESNHRAVDVRFVAATHRDLREMVNAGAFREDLYFRLAVVPLEIPPLRSRLEDIPILVEHFLAQLGRGAALEPLVVNELASRPWIGNVRELRNFVERAVALGSAQALAMSRGGAEPTTTRIPFPESLLAMSFRDAREHAMDELERAYVQSLLARHDRNVAVAAAAAGLDKSYVHKLMRKHGL
jgi:transcriptional regulator with GAF, ATPase, and Fis domain